MRPHVFQYRASAVDAITNAPSAYDVRSTFVDCERQHLEDHWTDALLEASHLSLLWALGEDRACDRKLMQCLTHPLLVLPVARRRKPRRFSPFIARVSAVKTASYHICWCSHLRVGGRLAKPVPGQTPYPCIIHHIDVTWVRFPADASPRM